MLPNNTTAQSSWKREASAFCLIPLLAPMAALQMSKEHSIPMQPRTCRTMKMTSLACPLRDPALLITIRGTASKSMVPSYRLELLWSIVQPYELKAALMH